MCVVMTSPSFVVFNVYVSHCNGLTMWRGSSEVRVPVRPRSFSLLVTFGGSVWVHARAASSKGTVSVVPAWFRADQDESILAGENYNGLTMWLGSSEVRVLAQ